MLRFRVYESSGKVRSYVFRFPTNPDQRNKWISAIRRDNWSPSEYSRLCSDHFLTAEQKFYTELLCIRYSHSI